MALACACRSTPIAPGPDSGPDVPDLGEGDLASPPDFGPRLPWRTISPTPEDSNLHSVYGTTQDDYYLVTSGAVVHRVLERSSVEWRADGPACLRSVFVVGTLAVAAGGCGGSGLLLTRADAGAWQARELANVDLAGIWAQRPEEVFVASPSLGVIRVAGADVKLERTVAAGDLGTGPVALWGSAATDLYAVGNGRILRRRGEAQWDVERSFPGELQLGVWGSATSDVYVVGSAAGMGVVWHRSIAGAPFQQENIDDGRPTSLSAVWGNGKDDVYAAGDGGLVLRRNPATGRWATDRQGTPEQPGLRALWGSGPLQLYGAGPGGLARRRPGPTWDVALGQALTGATLRAVALTGPKDGFAVGVAGVVLHQQGGAWAREARGLTEAALSGVAVASDGVVYAVGEGGLVLRRDRAGLWGRDRDTTSNADGGMPDGGAPAEGALLAVTVLPGGTVYAVGERGQILSRQGGVWQKEPLALSPQGDPVTSTLRAVSALPDGAVVAAGDSGTVLWRAKGAAGFTAVRSDPAVTLSFTGLLPLSGPSGPELIGCSSGAAVLLRFRGGLFSQESAPLAQASGVWGAAPDDLYLSGADGTVWHFDGWRWQKEPTPQGEPLLALAGAGGGDGATVLAVGAEGFMIQRP